LRSIAPRQSAATFDAYLHKPYNPADSRISTTRNTASSHCAKKKKCCA
jgi:hypothetical protein